MIKHVLSRRRQWLK